MSKTYKDSRHDKNRRDENTRKRIVKHKNLKRQNKYKSFVNFDVDDILLVHSHPGNWDEDWAGK